MANIRVRASAVVAFFALGLIAASGAQASITFLTPQVSLGRVAPEANPVVPVAALVVLDDAWRLAMTLDREQMRCDGAAGAACSDRIEVRIASGEWLPLRFDLPVLAGEGTVPSSGGAAATFQLRFRIGWESRVGRHEGVIRCSLNGGPSVDLRYEFEVQPTVSITSDDLPLKSPAVNPALRTTYDYEPRSFTLHSNVPWVVEVSIREPLKAEGSSTTIKGDPLRVMAKDGQPQLLAPGHPPVTVASGVATGTAAATVMVRLAAQTSAGGVAAGAYKTDLVIEARPQLAK